MNALLLGLFSRRDINRGVDAWSESAAGVLLDVRTREEYAAGHIDGSLNIPLQDMDTAEKHIPEKSAPVFVYCQSGARSARAAHILKSRGYLHVTDIGGISGYRGKIV